MSSDTDPIPMLQKLLSDSITALVALTDADISRPVDSHNILTIRELLQAAIDSDRADAGFLLDIRRSIMDAPLSEVHRLLADLIRARAELSAALLGVPTGALETPEANPALYARLASALQRVQALVLSVPPSVGIATQRASESRPDSVVALPKTNGMPALPTLAQLHGALDLVYHAPSATYRTQQQAVLAINGEKPHWVSVNRVGGEILRLCDGTRTVGEVAGELVRRHGIEYARAATDTVSSCGGSAPHRPTTIHSSGVRFCGSPWHTC